MSTIKEILQQLAAQGLRLDTVHTATADSRQVRAGDIFVALPGQRSDGRQHIPAAIAQGAAAVLWEADGAHDLQLPAATVPGLAVSGLSALSAELAALIHGQPAEALWVCGVTGTNGKTTVSQWIAQASRQLGSLCGVIGTLGAGLPGQLRTIANTTPDVFSVQRTLADLREAGAQACAMEVSSIGLDQGRVAGVHIDTAVFTNLSRDHLEYHGDMLRYAAAKARLFDLPGLRTAVLNLDEPLGQGLAENLTGKGVRCIGYSLDENLQPPAGVTEWLLARDLRLDGRGLQFTLCYFTAAHASPVEMSFAAALLGRFNVANLLAVFGSLLGAGHALPDIVAACRELQAPPGRLQIIASAQQRDEPLLVVDYAHTPDALEKVLITLRELGIARGGRLVCLFGCGGNRDPGKRPLMGRVAERLADAVIVTSDNPRNESPEKIITMICEGMTRQPQVVVEREQAVMDSVLTLDAADVLLIAGKGHEPYQEILGEQHPYSDLDTAAAALKLWKPPS